VTGVDQEVALGVESLDAMVRVQVEARGIRDRRVLQAMREVPRDRFVPPELRSRAFEDGPLPIGGGQTISQPYIVALMTAEARIASSARVLEVGTGCGYQTAVLARLALEVCSVEVRPDLAADAEVRLAELGARNVRFRVGDGSAGWPERSPFDAIVVTCAALRVPSALLAQIAVGGCMVIPVGAAGSVQSLLRIDRRPDGSTPWTELCAVRFVPLVHEP